MLVLLQKKFLRLYQNVFVPDDYVEDPNASEINLPKLDYSKFVPYLIKEVQVLSNEIQKLNNRISKLESDVV